MEVWFEAGRRPGVGGRRPGHFDARHDGGAIYRQSRARVQPPGLLRVSEDLLSVAELKFESGAVKFLAADPAKKLVPRFDQVQLPCSRADLGNRSTTPIGAASAEGVHGNGRSRHGRKSNGVGNPVKLGAIHASDPGTTLCPAIARVSFA